MKGRPRKLPGARKKNPTAGSAPDPSTSDPGNEAISDRISNAEKEEIAKRVIEHIERHAQAHGSFSGLADFLEQCEQLIGETRAKRGKLAVAFANSLARDVSSLRQVADALSPEMRGLIHRGVTTGFLLSNLQHEIADGKDRRGEKFSLEEYFAAVASKPQSRQLLADYLQTTPEDLNRWERKYLR